MTLQEKNAGKIIEILEKAGHTALFAGGYVRDKIMGRKIHDIDIATSATPEETIKALDKNKVKHIEIGESFGVVAAIVPLTKKTNQLIEIATFRSDYGTADQRHPQKVKFNVSIEEDVLRRDFTINGLVAKIQNPKLKITKFKNSLKIIPPHLFENKIVGGTPLKAWGKLKIKNLEIIDYVDGFADIKTKTIRFIGEPEERIKEDALRMMRATRFAAQLDFVIEEKSFDAIRKHSADITKISGERLRDELNKILTSPNPSHGLKLLDDLGLLHFIIPEIDKSHTCDQPPSHHAEGTVWNHMLLCLKNMRKHDDPIYALGVLFHDLAKAYTIQTPEKDGTDRVRFTGHDVLGAKMTGVIMRRLKYSREEIDKAQWLVQYHMLFGNLAKMREARKIMYLKHPYFPDLLELFWVDANSSLRTNKRGQILPPDLTVYNRTKSWLEEEENKKPLPKPIITGHDIMKLMGITSGNKVVGKVLEEVYNQQLEGTFQKKKEGLVVAKKIIKKLT
ncbi:CCA tRNA nucleotidyltransferase [Candidatus Microgenomates bacterium]|nr:CCA tRNA nucleotidyltransferase [Candidatus Microgenomates bacterium]